MLWHDGITLIVRACFHRRPAPEVKPDPLAVRSLGLRLTAAAPPPRVTVVVLPRTNSGMLWLLP